MKKWIPVLIVLLFIACHKSDKNPYSFYRQFIPAQIKDSIYLTPSNFSPQLVFQKK